jgi:cell division protein FtsZ
MQAGDETDVIVGMGYDSTLDKKIGITLIATGFEHKDPFTKPATVKKAEPKPEKIIMTLGVEGEEKKLTEPPVQQQTLPFENADPFAPSLQEEIPAEQTVNIFSTSAPKNSFEQKKEETDEKAMEPIHFELSTEITDGLVIPEPPKQQEVKVPKSDIEENIDGIKLTEKNIQEIPASSFLSKPFNIYAESPVKSPVSIKPETEVPKLNIVEEPVVKMQAFEKPKEESEEIRPGITEKKEVSAQAKIPFEDTTGMDEADEQRRRAAERIQKLRNLSFNMNTADPNNEFESVPAYVRRNMELFGNTLTSVENFYSKYTVAKDENDDTHISSINTFLDGKKPD